MIKALNKLTKLSIPETQYAAYCLKDDKLSLNLTVQEPELLDLHSIVVA